jgi:uncharacterized membrane protein
VLKRFLFYGVAGWVVEVLFTGVASAVKRDRSATAKTYLWMHPIYGGTALVLEQVSKRMKRAPFWAHGLAYTGVIYAAEYSSGWILRRGTGKCPWDYSGSGRDVHGLVRLDYAPAWYALGLLFEPLQALIAKTESLPEGATAPAPVTLAPASEVPEAIAAPASPPKTPQPIPEGLAELEVPPAVTRLAHA